MVAECLISQFYAVRFGTEEPENLLTQIPFSGNSSFTLSQACMTHTQLATQTKPRSPSAGGVFLFDTNLLRSTYAEAPKRLEIRLARASRRRINSCPFWQRAKNLRLIGRGWRAPGDHHQISTRSPVSGRLGMGIIEEAVGLSGDQAIRK